MIVLIILLFLEITNISEKIKAKVTQIFEIKKRIQFKMFTYSLVTMI